MTNCMKTISILHIFLHICKRALVDLDLYGKEVRFVYIGFLFTLKFESVFT